MRKMVSVPKLIIVMKPNLSAPLLLLSTGPPFYIILENIIELLQVPAWQCTQEKYEDKLDFYILDLLIAHLWWLLAQLWYKQLLRISNHLH